MKLLEKLEEIKQMGNYAVNLFYGEDIGADDSDIPQKDRRAVICFVPVGCLGEVRIMWRGKIAGLLKYDFKTKPTKISNPPKREEYKDDGYYIWGTERSVDSILDKPFFGKWKKL